MQYTRNPAFDDGEVDAHTRRSSALEWLTNRTFGASSVVFFTVLILWTAILITGFVFFLRNAVVGHGIDAAFSSFGLIISFIYNEFYKQWRTHKRDAVVNYFRAREKLKRKVFMTSSPQALSVDDVLLFHLALYQSYSRYYVVNVYYQSMANVYHGDTKEEVEQLLNNPDLFLSDFILHQRNHSAAMVELYDLLSEHVTDAKVLREVPVPSIYNVHTYFLFFIALFVLYPFATWVAVGSLLSMFAVPFVLFMLFVPFVVDSVIGDPWAPDRIVDIGAHEQWFSEDVKEYREKFKQWKR